MPPCTDCGGTIIEYDAAAGNGFCVQCGTVVEENTIVSEVTFGETSGGAAMVQGSYVGQGSTHARMSGPFGNRGTNESREQTIANASQKIQSIATVLHLSEVVCLAATRLYTLAVEHKFTKGRKSLSVVAVCLYVACRQKETRNYMLIDFSDLLQVNVFDLGHIYLQLVQTLNLRLPLVDPSHYISRFAALLEFGSDTPQVAADAVRLVQRFDRDWMAQGRRPAGICGAALLLAARMNNYRRSVEEIVQVVKIAEGTLLKRVEEFKVSGSAKLTIGDFRRVWLEEEMDPPAFTKGKEGEEGETKRKKLKKVKPKSKERGKRKRGGRKRKKGEDSEVENENEEPPEGERAGTEYQSRPVIDPTLLTQGILAGTSEPLFLPDPADMDADSTVMNIDPSLLPSPLAPPLTLPQLSHRGQPNGKLTRPPTELPVEADIPQSADPQLNEEVFGFLSTGQGSQLASALDDAEVRRMQEVEVDDELLGLDEDELDAFLLSEEEVRIKERVWVEINRDYLEALAAKGEQQETGSPNMKSRKRRKTTSTKPRDASTPSGSTAAESVQNLIKKNPKYSRRINYDALKDLFVDTGTRFGGDDKDDGTLYSFDEGDKSEGETTRVIVEEGGVVGTKPSARQVLRHVEENEENEESEKEDGDIDDTGVGWEDAYEQEV